MRRDGRVARNVGTVAALLAVVGVVPVLRAGGLALYEIGSPDVGLAAAGYAARAQEASTVFTNPAGMTLLPGTQVMVGVEALYGNLQFDTSSQTTTGGDGDNAIGLIPSGSMFVTTQLSDTVTAGFGVFSYFGLALDYGDDWAGRYYVQNDKLQGLTMMPSVAWQVTPEFSVGAGLNAMYATVEDEVALNNIAPRLADGQLKYEDSTWGYGGEFGVMYQFSKQTRVGATYLTPVDLNFKDNPRITGLGPVLGAVVDRRQLTNLKMDVTVPQMAMVSGYHELNDQWAVMGNVGWQQWSQFGQLGVEVDSANPKSVTVDINAKDTWHVAAGTQYKPSEKWSFSTGLAYDSAMLDGDHQSFTLPSGEAWRWGIGTTYAMNKNWTVGLGYELIWSGNIGVNADRGPLAGHVDGQYNDVAIQVLALSIMWRS